MAAVVSLLVRKKIYRAGSSTQQHVDKYRGKNGELQRLTVEWLMETSEK